MSDEVISGGKIIVSPEVTGGRLQIGLALPSDVIVHLVAILILMSKNHLG